MNPPIPTLVLSPAPPVRHHAPAKPDGLDTSPRSTLLPGILVGLLAAAVGALYTVMARYGIVHGLAAADMTFMRFGVAGLITLPVLAYHLRLDAAAMLGRWRVWLAVALLAGPLFGLMMFTAFEFAPPSHAAVFPFAAMSVMGTLLAVPFLADRLSLRKLVGIAIVVLGLVLLSGLSRASISPRALIGDAMFIAAGTMWAGFGILLRRHRLNPLLASAVVSFFALVTYVPIYLWQTGAQRLLDAAPSLVLIELLVQGAIAGAGTLYTYAKAVQLLGAARASIFPALTPGIAALMGWPVLGHIPSPLEAIGLGVAILGLLISVTGATVSRKPA